MGAVLQSARTTTCAADLWAWPELRTFGVSVSLPDLVTERIVASLRVVVKPSLRRPQIAAPNQFNRRQMWWSGRLDVPQDLMGAPAEFGDALFGPECSGIGSLDSWLLALIIGVRSSRDCGRWGGCAGLYESGLSDSVIHPVVVVGYDLARRALRRVEEVADQDIRM
jgi:hypothetical protein